MQESVLKKEKRKEKKDHYSICSSYSWEHTYRYGKRSQKYCLEFMTWPDVMTNIKI